jgi:hypothetical protein
MGGKEISNPTSEADIIKEKGWKYLFRIVVYFKSLSTWLPRLIG